MTLRRGIPSASAFLARQAASWKHTSAGGIAVPTRLGMRPSAGLVRAFGLETLKFEMRARDFQRAVRGTASPLPSGGSSQ